MENPAYFTRLPESMEVADIGPYFRGLREHYKLSEQDVSSRLHIRVKYIQAIEMSDVSQLPGKVYARGYIATYAEFLGIDPEQAVERLLGAETKEKVEEYFIPEPARLGAGLGFPIRLGLVTVVLLALVYLWIQDPADDAADSTVVPVPEALVESSRSLVMPTNTSLRCAQGEKLGACLDRLPPRPPAHPLGHPDIFTADAPWQPAVPKEKAPPAKEAKEVKQAKEAPAKPKKETSSTNPLPWLR